MPPTWKKGINPYRSSYFGVLGLGPNAQPAAVMASQRNLENKVAHGTQHLVDGRAITLAELSQAGSALLQQEEDWATEVLLAHPAPAGDSRRLQRLCSAVGELCTPPPAERALQLANPKALVPLLPEPAAIDVAWPEWEDLDVAGPESLADRLCDVQFDL